ncbi:MAG: NADP-dependent oxidoreductase [Pseudomonadales bacterium]
MNLTNRCVVLASRPEGAPAEHNFALESRAVSTPKAGEILCRNRFISLDAGFRNWMDEGSGDHVLPEMPLGEPVMGLTLSEVIDSQHPRFKVGDLLMARFAWEEYTLTAAEDFLAPLGDTVDQPLNYYLGILGDTGLSAYFGLMDYGEVKPGETVLVSAAAGAVGNVAGQIAKHLGARTVGISSGADKCARLIAEIGYDAAIDRNAADLPGQFRSACPDGVDVYFDNVGGPLLETVLDHINEHARILLCGSVATYNNKAPAPGPNNLFQLTTNRALMRGFMTHMNLDRYPHAREQLNQWVQAGHLKVIEYKLKGIDQVGRAFCDLFAGNNFGKTIVEL